MCHHNLVTLQVKSSEFKLIIVFVAFILVGRERENAEIAFKTINQFVVKIYMFLFAESIDSKEIKLKEYQRFHISTRTIWFGRLLTHIPKFIYSTCKPNYA